MSRSRPAVTGTRHGTRERDLTRRVFPKGARSTAPTGLRSPYSAFPYTSGIDSLHNDPTDSHHCRFTMKVLCDVRTDFTYTRIIYANFVLRRLRQLVAGVSSRRTEFDPGYWWNDTERGISELRGQKPVPMTLGPPLMRHELAWDWTLASAVVGWRLTTWATVGLFAHQALLFVPCDPQIRRRHQPSGRLSAYDEFSSRYELKF